MKVLVDQARCSSAGVCVIVCPEVFRFQIGSKKAKAIEDEIPAELMSKCLEAVEQCPEKAIIIVEQ